MTQPKYDLDKAMASDAARSIIRCVLEKQLRVYDFSFTGQQLREAARLQSVEEAAVAYAEYNSGDTSTWNRVQDLRLLDAYREARAREAAEKAGE